jgi:hypothetical protein
MGCAAHPERLRDAREAYCRGDLAGAQLLASEVRSARARDKDCVRLDAAMVALAAGDASRSESLLRQVRDRFDHLEQQSLGEQGLALLTDETAVAYAGEDYEQVLVRAVLAVSNLLQDGTDATAYCLQAEARQRQLLHRAEAENTPQKVLPVSRVALSAYLNGALLEASHRDYDDAQRAFATVAAWEPAYPAASGDLERARRGVHSTPGHGVVYVVTFVGRGPYKVEATAPATSEALLLADRILSHVGDHTLPPTLAPVKIPMVVVPPNRVQAVGVSIGNRAVGTTQTITDVGRLAVAQNQARRDQHIAEAVVRRVVKKAAVYTAKDALAVSGGLTNLALDAAGVLWEAREHADTRCWRLLPAKIQVLRLELPAGSHRVTLYPVGGGQVLGPLHATTVEVIDGDNTYVFASFPGEHLVGRVVSSRGG